MSVCSLLQDWWTCVDFKTFYRKWNHLVYDWIHAYIYRDLRAVRVGPSKAYTDASMYVQACVCVHTYVYVQRPLVCVS